MTTPENTQQPDQDVHEVTDENLEEVTGAGRAEDWGGTLTSPGTLLMEQT
jgi:hypothetical protein